MSEKTLEEAAKAITNGDAEKAADLAKRGLDEGIEPLKLLDHGFVPGINEVGDLFSKGKLFIPMLIRAATAMEKATEIINAAIPQGEEVAQGRVDVVGTKVTYQGKFGVVVLLNQGSEDPTASTVNIRLEDGTVIDGVSVASTGLELFRQ